MEYISEVNRTHSISLAAQKLHVSQAAVSQSISHLEKEIGVVIFHRSRIGTLPTEEGKFIIKTADEILERVKKIRNEGTIIDSTYSGELIIGAIPSLFITLLPQTLANFKADYPNVSVSIRELGGKEIIEALSNSQIDIGLTILTEELLNHSNKSLEARMLLEGTMYVCVSKKSSLSRLKKIHIQDLKDHPLVVYGGKNWSEYIKRFEQQFGNFNILLTTNNSEVIKRMISENLAIGLLTDVMLINDIYINNGDIVKIPLIDYHPKIIHFGSVRLPHNKERLVKKFLDYLQIFTSDF